jgi:hypothetical protein
VQAWLRSIEQLMPPDVALVMDQPDGLWDRLARLCERLRNTI